MCKGQGREEAHHGKAKESEGCWAGKNKAARETEEASKGHEVTRPVVCPRKSGFYSVWKGATES